MGQPSNPSINDFARRHSAPESPLLASLRKATWQRTRHGRLMSDPHTGRVLATLSRIARPKTILELGTFSGYGTLCLLEGLHPAGTLHTVERNDELFALQDEFWHQAPGHGRIRRHHAEVMEVLDQWDVLCPEQGALDLVYVDADKENVNAQLDALLPLLSEGGTMAFDNVWWDGTVDTAAGRKAESLRTLNARLFSDERLHALVLPIGDGVTVVQKR